MVGAFRVGGKRELRFQREDLDALMQVASPQREKAMITDAERMARIGELLRLRGLIMATHEEQLERIDGRLHDVGMSTRAIAARVRGLDAPP